MGVRTRRRPHVNERSNLSTAATIIDGPLTPFADRCRDVAGVDAIGVLLVTSTTQLEVMAWSSDARPYLAALELQTRQGPCLESYRTNQPVATDDLAGTETSRRWPLFAPVAARAGLSGAGAVPMRLGHRVVGGMSLLRCHPVPIDAETLSAVQEMADRMMVDVLRPNRRRTTVLRR